MKTKKQKVDSTLGKLNFVLFSFIIPIALVIGIWFSLGLLSSMFTIPVLIIFYLNLFNLCDKKKIHSRIVSPLIGDYNQSARHQFGTMLIFGLFSIILVFFGLCIYEVIIHSMN